MATETTIDHGTLSRLVDAGAIRAAQVIGQGGGWALSVKYGMAERFLAAQRSGKLRQFRKLETVTAYLRELGISRFEVDASGFDPDAAKSGRKREDTAQRLRAAHEAAEHDRWFRAQVQQAIDAADQPGAVLIPHDVVMGRLKARLDRIAAQQAG
jgi:hypothetical protein